MSASASGVSRLRRWLDDDEHPNWRRPGPSRRQMRNDVVLALVLAIAGLASLVLMSSYGLVAAGGPVSLPEYVVAAVSPLTLVVRRRFPLSTLIASSAVFVPLFYTSFSVSLSVVFQASYFAAIYTTVAWAAHRRATWITLLVITIIFTSWLGITWAASPEVLEDLQSNLAESAGPINPVVAYAIYATLLNLAYLCGAAAFGRGAWRAALRRDRLEHQARTIRDQAQRLARNAVVEERLRLARDLHDSIGHHFTGVGLQAGGARRILAASDDGTEVRLSPAQAGLVRESMAAIETSTREGIGELQTVLRLLRDPDEVETVAGGPNGTTKSIQDLPELVAGFERMGLSARLSVSDRDRAHLDNLSESLSTVYHHGVYRMVEESLTNVLKHSDANEAQVHLSVNEETEELLVDVVEHGKPVSHVDQGVVPSTGSGLRGMQERASVLGGRVESTSLFPWPGWRTKLVLPLPTDQHSPRKDTV